MLYKELKSEAKVGDFIYIYVNHTTLGYIAQISYIYDDAIFVYSEYRGLERLYLNHTVFLLKRCNTVKLNELKPGNRVIIDSGNSFLATCFDGMESDFVNFNGIYYLPEKLSKIYLIPEYI